MKKLAFAAFAATLAIGVAPVMAPALAQDVGVSIRAGDGPRERVRVRDDDDAIVRRRTVIHDRDADDVAVRRRGRHPDVMLRTGSIACKTITVRKENDEGQMVVKRIKKCS